MEKVLYFCQILNKCGFPQQIFVEACNIKFQIIATVKAALIHADRQTDMAQSVGDFRDYIKARKMHSDNKVKSLLVTLILTHDFF